MRSRAGCGAAALVATLLAAPAIPASAQQAASSRLDAAAGSITAVDFARHLGALSADSMKGRLTGTPEVESAARYIAGEFRRAGLKPLGGNELIRRYTLRFNTLDAAATRLTVSTNAGLSTFAYGKDFVVLPSARPALNGDIVFLGTAPVAAGHLPAELKGKIATFYLPGPLDRDLNRRIAQANREATEVGAIACLFVVDSTITDAFFARFRPYAERERSELERVPQIAVAYRAAAALLSGEGQDPSVLSRTPAGAPPAFTGFQLDLAQPLKLREIMPPNVVAVLRGSDKALRDEYVVVSAHFDHVGVGRPNASGDSIYNGADDNASGTVALLEIAQAFRQKGVAPARSVIFLAVSGEEEGLRGSAAWVAQPPVQLGSIVADINLDMVTRNSPDTVAVLGQELSTMGEAVRAAASAHPDLKLTVARGNPWPTMDLLYMSDQLPFLQAGVPSVFFFTGPHDDLHQPSDEIGHCDVDKGARVARLAFLSAHAVASAPARPDWTEEGKKASFRAE